MPHQTLTRIIRLLQRTKTVTITADSSEQSCARLVVAGDGRRPWVPIFCMMQLGRTKHESGDSFRVACWLGCRCTVRGTGGRGRSRSARTVLYCTVVDRIEWKSTKQPPPEVSPCFKIPRTDHQHVERQSTLLLEIYGKRYYFSHRQDNQRYERYL